MKNIINRIKNDKVLFFLSILIIGVFLVLVIRITYSYLAAYINEARENVTIGSDTTDKLEFFEGNPIDLNVTSTTLPEGGGNYAQSTTYRAELTANSTNNTAEDSYYVYFNVAANTLNYTQEGNPEVILTVFQDDTEITNIDGLTYGTYNGVTGFDVTTASGMFTVASDYAITSNSSTDATVQNWTFTLTYLNQNYDQSGNYGNNMNVEFIMTKEERITLANYIISQYTTDGENGIYYHDGIGSYTNADQEAGDNSYRYSGANPNNYVCFGSDVVSCPSDNLYRIIGVFDNQVKLIKHSFASTNLLGNNGAFGSGSNYYWNSVTRKNNWSESNLNNINLNNNYLNNIGALWSSKINYKIEWNLGGYDDNNIAISKTAKSMYLFENGELVYEGNPLNVVTAIGLMYVSDYGYAASPNYWNINISNYDDAINDNWLYSGGTEWTIVPIVSDNIHSSYLDSDGTLSVDNVGDAIFGIRPCFYLNSNVTYVSGTGTQTDPYRIV